MRNHACRMRRSVRTRLLRGRTAARRPGRPRQVAAVPDVVFSAWVTVEPEAADAPVRGQGDSSTLSGAEDIGDWLIPALQPSGLVACLKFDRYFQLLWGPAVGALGLQRGRVLAGTQASFVDGAIHVSAVLSWTERRAPGEPGAQRSARAQGPAEAVPGKMRRRPAGRDLDHSCALVAVPGRAGPVRGVADSDRSTRTGSMYG